MLNILTRRAPWIHVLVFPVRVQGQGVEKETIRALEMLNRAEAHGLPVPDTIVIGRGGGSIEDLWAYNEESLARAIFASQIPVISAVGHEIDFTIADFVADLRAPTPSAAAELLAPDVTELKRHFESLSRRLGGQVMTLLDRHEQTLDFIARGALKTAPAYQLQTAEQAVDDLEDNLKVAAKEQLRGLGDLMQERQQIIVEHHPRIMLMEAAHRLENQAQQLQQKISHKLERLADQVTSRAQLMKHLGPESILARGFSYTTDAQGNVIRDAADVEPGQTLVTRLQQGQVKSTAV
jgi:exodeoxyribonuclease VII large subunit